VCDIHNMQKNLTSVPICVHLYVVADLHTHTIIHH